MGTLAAKIYSGYGVYKSENIMKHTLEISNIKLLYGERLVLSDVYLKIETGNIVGLLRKNGSDKSSFMRNKPLHYTLHKPLINKLRVQ